VSYSVAPIMVILLNLLTIIDKEKIHPFIFFMGLVVCYFLLLFIFAYYKFEQQSKLNQTSSNQLQLHKSKNNKLKPIKLSNYMFNILNMSKVGAYLILILLSGITINLTSLWIIDAFNDEANQYLIIVTFFSIGMMLLLIQYIIENELFGDKHLWMIFGVFIVSSFFWMTIKYFPRNFELYKFFSFIALSLYAVILFHKVARTFAKPYNAINENEINPCKEHLIIFLSSIFYNQINTWNLVDFKQKSLLKIYSDLIVKDDRHAWEMSLRSIEYHLENDKEKRKLKQLTIVASSNKDGKKEPSILQAKEFIKQLCTYFDYNYKNERIIINLVVIENNTVKLKNEASEITYNSNYYTKGFGINFGSYKETSDTLKELLKFEPSIIGNHSEIVIDFTGGQKSTTVAATLAATIYDVNNQYVDTGSKKINGYNFKYITPTQI